MHTLAPLLLVAASVAASAVTPESGLAPETILFASPTTHDHVGRVVVPVTINHQGPFRFIVDTGANHSTISPQLAAALGLVPTEATPILLDGITGSAHVGYVTVDQLQAGELLLEGEILPVVPALALAGADGILGAAGLQSKSLMVDFQHNRVSIGRNVAAAMRNQSTRIHADRLTYGLITLQIKVGGIHVLAVLDTGSERTLGNLALRNALHAQDRPGGVVEVTTVYGATKETELAEIRAAPPIVLDSLRINDVKVLYGDFHIFRVWEMSDAPAMVIGMDVLGTVPALGIDFEKHDVYVAGVPGAVNPYATAAPGVVGNAGDKR